MQSIVDAWRVMEQGFLPLGLERVALENAVGRFLASAVHAQSDAPPFSNSAMDGYAVRASDVIPGKAMAVRGESRAGGDAPEPLLAESAMRIFTGAPLPSGADAVIAQEDAERSGGSVVFSLAPNEGKFVRWAGSAIAEGAVLAEQGTGVHPGLVALFASQGIGRVAVRRRPRVAILVSGDELRDLGDAPRPGSIVDANGPTLVALVREAGGVPTLLPRAGDEEAALLALLEEALTADLVVTSGGVSVGDYDLLPGALEKLGVKRELWKIAIKPGKPVLFGRAGRTPVLALPGNPVSAYVTGQLFLVPGIRKMLGDPAPFPAPLRVVLGKAVQHRPGRQQWFRASLEWQGQWIATPHAHQGSGALPSVGEAEVLIPLGAECARLDAGEEVTAWPLRLPRLPRPLWESVQS